MKRFSRQLIWAQTSFFWRVSIRVPFRHMQKNCGLPLRQTVHCPTDPRTHQPLFVTSKISQIQKSRATWWNWNNFGWDYHWRSKHKCIIRRIVRLLRILQWGRKISHKYVWIFKDSHKYLPMSFYFTNTSAKNYIIIHISWIYFTMIFLGCCKKINIRKIQQWLDPTIYHLPTTYLKNLTKIETDQLMTIGKNMP